MDQDYFEHLSERPEVVVFADPDCVGLSIVNSLLSSFCYVKVISSNVTPWKNATSLLKESKYFEIVSLEEGVGITGNLGYLIFVNSELTRTKNELNQAVKISKDFLGKKFMLLPFLVESKEEKKNVFELKEYFLGQIVDGEVMYSSDVVGPNLNGNSYLAKVFEKIIFEQTLPLSEGLMIYPISPRDLSKEIVKYLFSFGPPSRETVISGKDISLESLVRAIRSETGVSNFNLQIKLPQRIEVSPSEKVVFDVNFLEMVKETVGWYKKNPPKKYSEKESSAVEKRTISVGAKPDSIRKIDLSFKSPSFFSLTNLSGSLNRFFKKVSTVFFNLGKKRKRNKNSGVFYFIAFAAITFLTPYLLLLFSLAAFLGVYDGSLKGNIKQSMILSSVSRNTSLVSKTVFGYYERVPLLSIFYKDLSYLPSLILEGNVLFSRFFDIYTNLRHLSSGVLGKENVLSDSILDEIAVDAEVFYKDLSFYLTEIEALPKSKRTLVYKYIPQEKIESLRSRVWVGVVFAKNLKDVLGFEGQRKYMVLFQNNMELRPTGGFVGSFALLTFDKGRMVSMDIQDVYSADGQLRGHVEPPEAIRKYLGEANWYMRDANWDPDFRRSAEQIEWFLNKEIDQKVDGVFALDLEAVKNLLEIVGPLYLEDFGKEINTENLYEVTQTEVEENFFPGSRKKSNFLTALSKKLLFTLTESLPEKQNEILKSVVRSLEEKHFLLYFHNEDVSQAFEKANFDGSLKIEKCSGNCFYDFVSYIDANVGVNKANYFLERDFFLNVFFDGKQIKRTLRINFKNNANPMLGDRARYKTYFRLLVLPNSVMEDVELISRNKSTYSIPKLSEKEEYLEAGTLIEIPPGEEKTAVFSWTEKITSALDFSQEGALGIYFRKQPGTVEDSLTLNLYLPRDAAFIRGNNFSLTGEGSYLYNTILVRDEFPLIYW